MPASTAPRGPAIAGLPMYDGGPLAAANDALWAAVARRLRALGLRDVPARLERGRPAESLWADDRLLFGQICGYPFARQGGALRVVGVPSYAVAGCRRGYHRSFVVVRASSRARVLADVRGARVAVNDRTSVTGRHLLGEALARLGARGGFFSAVVATGSHAASLAAVAAGAADVASIDCVSYHHLARSAPAHAAATRVLYRTRPTPAPPFVVAAHYGERAAALVARALREATDDPSTLEARAALAIEAIVPGRADAYARTLCFAKRAALVFEPDEVGALGPLPRDARPADRAPPARAPGARGGVGRARGRPAAARRRRGSPSPRPACPRRSSTARLFGAGYDVDPALGPANALNGRGAGR